MFNHFTIEQNRHFLWFSVMMIAGVAAYFALPFEPTPWVMVLTPLSFFLCLVFRRANHPLIGGILLSLALGLNAAQVETIMHDTRMLDEKIEPTGITGRLIHTDLLPGGETRLTIQRPWIKEISREQRLSLVRIKTRIPYANVPDPGSRINLWGPLWPPSAPAAPGDYDFRRNAYFKGIGASGMNYGELRVREQRYPPHFFWDGFFLLFEKARRAMTLRLLSQNNDNDALRMTIALMTGGQSGIAEPTMDALRVAGLSHLLSISGVHVSAAALLIFVPLRFLFALWPWFALRFPVKKIAAGIAILSTTFYTLLVGPEAPTLRSAIATSLIMLGVLIDRKVMSLRLVALAAALLTLIMPNAVMGPSFQMSFAAVLAMVAAYEKRVDQTIKNGVSLPDTLPGWARSITRHARDMVATSLIATAATAPFTLFHFQTFSFYGVIANMVAIPLTSFAIMPCLLLAYLAFPFGADSVFVAGAQWGCGILIDLAQKVALWPLAQIFMPPMPLWAFGFFVVGFLWLCLWHNKARWIAVIPLALACFYPLFVSLPLAFIDEEGTPWAVRVDDGHMATFGKRTENFALHQWRQRSLNPELILYSKKNPPPADSPLTCDETACYYTTENQHLVFLSPKATPEDRAKATEKADVVISKEPLAGLSAPMVIDKQSLRQKGAHVIYLEKGVLRAKAARSERGLRPWSPGWRENRISISEPIPPDAPEP